MLQYCKVKSQIWNRLLAIPIASQKSLLYRNVHHAADIPSQVIRTDLSGNDKGITLLTLNRKETLNALGSQLLSELSQHCQDLRFDTNVRAVIINSAVNKAFCTGADLKERKKMNEQDLRKILYKLGKIFLEVENLPVPTIASVDGYAFGGGLELALSCDIRVIGSQASLGLVETKLAIIPGAGGTQRLSRLVGASRAKELIFTGKTLDAALAYEYGVVNHKCDEPSSLQKALEIAREILPKGPIAIRMAKQAIDQGLQVDKSTGFFIEHACYAQVIPTKDRLEGLQAFAEKRPPIYKGE